MKASSWSLSTSSSPSTPSGARRSQADLQRFRKYPAPDALPHVTMAVVITEYKTDELMIMRRNPYYWKVDEDGINCPTWTNPVPQGPERHRARPVHHRRRLRPHEPGKPQHLRRSHDEGPDRAPNTKSPGDPKPWATSCALTTRSTSAPRATATSRPRAHPRPALPQGAQLCHRPRRHRPIHHERPLPARLGGRPLSRRPRIRPGFRVYYPTRLTLPRSSWPTWA